MKNIIITLNPLARLGIKKYSFWFPLILNLLVPFISEFFAMQIAHNPEIVGSYIIFINVAFLIYFSFRDGIKGGLVTTVVSILYYLYIIFTREYSGDKLINGLDTTAILAIIYATLAGIIGFLKQRIDVLIVREIEARQIAEEGKLRLQTILQQLPVGVLMVDAKAKTMEGNKQLEQILGRKVNGNLAKISEENFASKDWPINRALQKGQTVIAEEREVTRDNQQKIIIKVNAAPIKNRNGQIIAAVSTISDITHEKDLENRKDDFINMASHELRTPITSMKIYIEILINLLKSQHDEKALKTITSIKSQTERLQELISDLLDVSRIQTGKLKFTKDQFVINDLLKEAAEILQTTSPSHQIIVKNSPKITFWADRFRIYQVLTNLMTNAIKYSSANTKIILAVTKSNNKVIVSVQDFGIGIEKSEQKKIFDRLYQVDNPNEKTFPGLGMGLFISHEIIKRHKGQIWVEGDKGKGSTFYFSLPLSK